LLIGDPVVGFKLYNVGTGLYVGGRTASGGTLTLVEEASACSFVPVYNSDSSVKLMEKTYGFYIDRASGYTYAYTSGQAFSFQQLYKVTLTPDQTVDLTLGGESYTTGTEVILSGSTAVVAVSTEGYQISAYETSYTTLADALANDTDGDITINITSDYSPQVASDITPWYDSANTGYFTLTTDGKTALDNAGYTAALTTCDYATYTALKAIVDNADNISYPATGYYRINSAYYPTYYLGYDGSSDGDKVCLRGMTDGGQSAQTVVYFTKGDGTYTFQLQGTNIGAASQSVKLQATETAANCSFVIIEPGVVSIQSGSGTYTYLHCSASQSYAIVGWSIGSASPASTWTIVDATEATVDMNAVDGTYYATLCAPFAYTVSGAAAYSIAVNGTEAETTAFSGEVAAGTPVLLMGSSDTATLTIGSDYASTVSDSYALTGTYTDVTVEAGTDYFLGTDGTKVGFYKWDGTTLKANRAYLAASTVSGTVSTGVKGFALNFGETGIESTVAPATEQGVAYNLAGQRVTKPVHGLYIINGKKVLVK